LCEILVAHVGEEQAAARAAGLLRGWVEMGMVSSYATDDAATKVDEIATINSG
jgi:hypothetical protein